MYLENLIKYSAVPEYFKLFLPAKCVSFKLPSFDSILSSFFYKMLSSVCVLSSRRYLTSTFCWQSVCIVAAVWATLTGLIHSVGLDHKFLFNLLCHDSFRSWPTFMLYLCRINIWLRASTIITRHLPSLWLFLGIFVEFDFTGRCGPN